MSSVRGAVNSFAPLSAYSALRGTPVPWSAWTPATTSPQVRERIGTRPWPSGPEVLPVQALSLVQAIDPPVTDRARALLGERTTSAVQLAEELFRLVPGAVQVEIDAEQDPEIDDVNQVVLTFRTVASASEVAAAESRLNDWMLSSPLDPLAFPIALNFEFI